MTDLPYNSFNRYLRAKYGQGVWRVTLEGGFTCPNRDGLKGFGGCTFCTADGSSSRAQDPSQSIAEQLASGIQKQRHRHRASKFIAYLQSFTNTYATLEKLKRIYDQAVSHADVVMLAIGTRPDCLPNEAIDLIATYTERCEVWVDLGLESSNPETLIRMNRCHSAEEFEDAIKRIKQCSSEIKVCAHMIAGLPPEDKDLARSLQTGRFLASLPIDGIKIHNLCILKHTALAKEYSQGKVRPLSMAEYTDLVVQILCELPPSVLIHRLMGEAPTKDELIAPSWATNKDAFLNLLRNQMNASGLNQGCKFPIQARQANEALAA